MENPVESDTQGHYRLILPEGTYELLIQKNGYERVRTAPFTLSETRFLSSSFTLLPRKGVRGFIENLLESVGANP